MRSSRSSSSQGPFDAVLIISFGGPQGMDEVRPFLERILRGRRIAPQALQALEAKYACFNGVSPLTEVVRRQADGLRNRLPHHGMDLPVYVGMRHGRPFLADTLAEMSRAGVRRAIGFITSAYHSWASCGQYKRDVIEARRSLRDGGLPDVELVYVESWYDHPGFATTWARHIEAALGRLDARMQDEARLVLTAHSIPVTMARASCYQQQLETTARLVARRLGRQDYALVYQSRSGSSEDPWLEPDVRDYLRCESAKGLRAVLIAPIGFVCDHVEVLYDLDVQTAQVCRELSLPMARAETVNDDPTFIDMMADVVKRTYDRYLIFPPLPIVGASEPLDGQLRTEN